MTNGLFVTLERHVLLIKNAIELISSPTNAYGRSIIKIWTKSNISQDKDDALPFYTGYQFPMILLYTINIDCVTTRLYTCNIARAIKYRPSCLCMQWKTLTHLIVVDHDKGKRPSKYGKARPPELDKFSYELLALQTIARRLEIGMANRGGTRLHHGALTEVVLEEIRPT